MQPNSYDKEHTETLIKTWCIYEKYAKPWFIFLFWPHIPKHNQYAIILQGIANSQNSKCCWYTQTIHETKLWCIKKNLKSPETVKN